MMDDLKNTSILISGGAGFVGSNLAKRLLRDGCRKLTIVDNLMSADKSNVPADGRVTFLEASIGDRDLLASLKDEYDYVFHLSTFHANESSIHRPLEDFENTLAPTMALYDRLSRFKNVRRIVYPSTGCALSAKGVSEQPTAVVEDGNIPLDYDSPYQISKVVGEMYSIYFNRMGSAPITRARFQNVYGPGEILGAGVWRGTAGTIWRNVVPIFVFRAIKGQELLIYGDGKSSRDFIYVDDIVEGLIRCAVTPGAEGDVFNLASGQAILISELAEKINNLTGNKSGIRYIEPRNWDRSIQRFGSTEKAARKLGFRASMSFDEGLERTVAWTKSNLPLIERCIKSHRSHCVVDFLEQPANGSASATAGA